MKKANFTFLVLFALVLNLNAQHNFLDKRILVNRHLQSNSLFDLTNRFYNFDQFKMNKEKYIEFPSSNSQVPKKLLDSIHFFDFDFSTSTHILSERRFFYYDGIGNNSSISALKFDESNNKWVKFDSTSIERNANSEIINSIRYIWDFSLNRFVEFIRNTYDYDINNHLILLLRLEWSGTDWSNFLKNEYKYNTQGQVVERSNFNWNEQTEEWVPSTRQEINYNAENNISEIITLKWDVGAMQYVSNLKDSYHYDQQNHLIEIMEFSFNNSNQEYEIDARTLFQRNARGQSIVETYQIYRTSIAEFVNVYRYRDTYDQDHDQEYYYLDFWEVDHFENVLEAKNYYSIHDVISSSNNVLEEKLISIYPIPAIDRIFIEQNNSLEGLSLSIRDINGNQVFIDKIQQGVYSIENLTPGIYFIKTEDSQWTRLLKIGSK